MPSNCEDVSAQMMELLYGELPADARANVDAHVAGCARCRSELEGFEKTRALARRGLDEAPPARARAAIMQAAAAHLAAQTQPAARKAAAPERVSFWDRLRVRWAFPTFATVGALAVFVVANQVFLKPERTLERSRAAESEEAPSLPRAPAPALQVAPTSAPSLAPPADREFAPSLKDEARPARRREQGIARSASAPRARDLKPTAESLDSLLPESSAGAKGDRAANLHKNSATIGEATASKKAWSDPPALAEPPAPAKAEAPSVASRPGQPADSRFAPPPPPREERAGKHKAPIADDAFDKQASEKSARRAAPAAPAASKVLDKPLDGDLARAPSAAGPSGGGGPSGSTRPSSVGIGGGSSSAMIGGAEPRGRADGFGSGAAQAAPAAAAPARAEAPKRVTAAPAAAPAPATTSVASAPAPASPAPAAKPQAKKGRSAYPADEGFEGEADAREEKKLSSATPTNANETLVLRAERLFADGRWTEAAAIYRELLRREPHNDDAERWRRRLVAAEAAEANARTADVAAKRNAEAEPARSRKAAPPKAGKSSGKAAASDAAQ